MSEVNFHEILGIPARSVAGELVVKREIDTSSFASLEAATGENPIAEISELSGPQLDAIGEGIFGKEDWNIASIAARHGEDPLDFID